MGPQNGAWRERWEAFAGRGLDLGRATSRGVADLLLPPLAHDSPEAMAAAGLTPDAWSRIVFLEDPVCDGCGAAFETDAGRFAETRCAACQAQPFAFTRARAACLYDEASRGLILRFKHGDHQPYAPLFARWIARAAAPLLAEADAVVPVPLHRLRLLSRRFNQAAEVARPLASGAGLDYLPDSLERTTRTAAQGGKSLRGRRLNVRTAFQVKAAGRRRIKGRRILLVDDVLTTGATAEACARALLDAGARAVDLAVIARVRRALAHHLDAQGQARPRTETALAEIVLYTKPGCPYCHAAMGLLDRKGADYTEIVASNDPAKKQEMIQRSGGRMTFPQIFIDGKHIGGSDDLHALDARGGLDPLLAA